MTFLRADLSQTKSRIFLAYVGMETDLMFNKGMDLPGFASYPLLESPDGVAQLKSYWADLMTTARQSGLGAILESPTWVANRDRAAGIGYAADVLMTLNRQAVDLMAEVRADFADVPTLLSLNVGPRADAYAPDTQMTASEAQDYHTEQIKAVADSPVDLISGYTLAYPAEAIGIVNATKQFDLPATISFTVETDGHLPTGVPLVEAIDQVDRATGSHAAYYMINCAHPDHFSHILTDAPALQRLRGIVANASRCSHAELDEAEELDDGNPVELGAQLAAIHRRHPNITILGGCCGTDMRHMTSIAQAVYAG